jgi:ABC-type nickel/cobalt efflux system permease component RcnA
VCVVHISYVDSEVHHLTFLLIFSKNTFTSTSLVQFDCNKFRCETHLYLLCHLPYFVPFFNWQNEFFQFTCHPRISMHIPLFPSHTHTHTHTHTHAHAHAHAHARTRTRIRTRTRERGREGERERERGREGGERESRAWLGETWRRRLQVFVNRSKQS